MKFSALTLSALAGSALAAPSEQFTTPGGNHHYQSVTKRSDFTTPGGDHQYQAISRRSAEKTFQLSKRIGTVGIAVASVAAGGFLGFVGGPLAARAMNSVFGVQKKKRNVHYDIADLTFDEARELWIEALVESIFEVNPHNGTADAAVCAGTGYYVSDPKATLSATAFQFRADGQEHE